MKLKGRGGGGAGKDQKKQNMPRQSIEYEISIERKFIKR